MGKRVYGTVICVCMGLLSARTQLIKLLHVLNNTIARVAMVTLALIFMFDSQFLSGALRYVSHKTHV